jgi:hypothetical protein
MTFFVDANVPYGNACDVSITTAEDITEVRFAPDPHGGPECLWFCFRLVQEEAPLSPSARVRLVLQNPDNMLGGNPPQSMRPVVRYGDGEDWQRLGQGSVQELPDGRRCVSWPVDAPQTTLDVAYCYPYGRPEVEALLRDTGGYWQVDTIGVSQEARPLLRLSNDYGQPDVSSGVDGQRSGLYLTARQHSGETPGSWVLDGFLRHIATLGQDAPLVWAVPLTHIDGVEKGDYGKDGFPYDLNRAWGRPPMRHEVLVYQQDIGRWAARCHPLLAIDLHAPGACETSGIYCYLPGPAENARFYQEALTWTTAIKQSLTCTYAAETFERVADYPSRWETPRLTGYCWAQHGVCGLGIETPYALVGDLVLTREHYREAGARIAAGVVSRLER